MSNFTQFQCDTCNRYTEQLNNQTHATLTKCTITYKCVGTLVKVSESDTKTLSGTDSQSQTLQSWVPRGAVSTRAATVAAPQVVVNSAQDTLSIAIANSLAGSATSLTMALEIKKVSNTAFVEFMYNRGSNASLVTGQDDSSKRLSLQFANGSNPDVLVIYVNGVQLDSSLYSRAVAGRVTFNPALSAESNLIRILVYKQVQASFATLTFNKNTVATPASAWANVGTIDFPKGNHYTVFTCSNVSSLLINSLLIIDSITINGATTSSVDGYFLRADAPYSNYDRDTQHAIELTAMIANQEVIYYKNDSVNSPKFFVDPDALTSLFPPLTITSKLKSDVIVTTVSSADTKLSNLYIT